MPAETSRSDPFAGLEAWTYTGLGKLYVARFTGRYGEVSYEPVHGGRTFHLTPAERRLNSEKVKHERNDPFKNGTCVAVTLTEETSEEDRQAIAENPAMLTNAAVIALFKGRGDAFGDHLAKIDNAIVLHRILALAEEADLPGSKITAIKGRIEEVSPADGGEPTEIPATGISDPQTAELYGDLGPRTISVG